MGQGPSLQPSPQEALGLELSSSICPPEQLLLLRSPLCTAQPLPLTAHVPTPGWAVSLPTGTGVLSVHILQEPIQKGAARDGAPSAPTSLHDLLRVPRGKSLGASNLVWKKKKQIYQATRRHEDL